MRTVAKRIKIEMYRHEILLIVVSEKIRAVQLCKEKLGYALTSKEEDLFCDGGNDDGGVTLELSGHRTLMWLPATPKDLADVSSVVHECYHAANIIFSDIGVKEGAIENDEPLAYFLQHIFEKVSKALGVKLTS